MFNMESRVGTSGFRSFVNGESFTFDLYAVKKATYITAFRAETGCGKVADGSQQIKFADNMGHALELVKSHIAQGYKLSSNHDGSNTINKRALTIWADIDVEEGTKTFDIREMKDNVPYENGTGRQDRFVFHLDWESLDASDIKNLFAILALV